MNYWLTPPELYAKLDGEFHFDFDPCPFPRTFDGLRAPWGSMNYVNPPFNKRDGSPTAFVRKAIYEQEIGKSSVLVLSGVLYLNLLLEAGAELRPAGRIKWLSTEDRTPMRAPGPSIIAVLRGKK